MFDATKNDEAITQAASLLQAGKLVAVPTETVYGLAADARNDEAVAGIFKAKGRPRFNPLIAHIASLDDARKHAVFSPAARSLAEAFWPGPLTLVLPKSATSKLSLLLSAGLSTIAVRAPAHPVTQQLLNDFGGPIAAPSANPFGAVSPTTADHVREGLGDKVAAVLDGGPCDIGVESTIIGFDDDGRALLLRPGGIPRAAIERVLGAPVLIPEPSNKPVAPGMLKSHYAPSVAVRLNAKSPKEGEAYLGFSNCHSVDPTSLNLSETGDLTEAAANLFSYLRRLDAIAGEKSLDTIAVAPIPKDGLGEAINDRLNRAAAPRRGE